MICRTCQRALSAPTPAARLLSRVATRNLSTAMSRSTSPANALRRYPARIEQPLVSRYSTSSPASPSSASSPASSPSPPAPEKPDHLDAAESWIWDKLAAEFEPAELDVRDVSGGCGSMYAIDIASSRFAGVGMLKQQRMVNAVLGDKVKEWHGVQLRTRAA